eukprot:CAMPEP_0182863140 /NCGR_PEP_ID=MMETSP0034_2-20130328/6471_1 /TAXON_ID=156128 /ORGANISM="Nephroselmis pyriformis, Strain CCMP717" /LENGTH=503 /DNA_ID=CAMNT_0024995311 /DNA_START=365 /DNA_END=1876 /DNA_ORIENTATION=-
MVEAWRGLVLVACFAAAACGAEDAAGTCSLSPEQKRFLWEQPNRHLQKLGKISDDPNVLIRTFMSVAHRSAAATLDDWMEDAGMIAWTDEVGNVHGRLESPNPEAKTILIGSHYDTVMDAGKYDGALGIITGIAAVKTIFRELEMSSEGLSALKHHIEVVAFSDEEGLRFSSTFLGSRAIAGTLVKHGMLKSTDKEGKSIADVIAAMGSDASEENIMKIAMSSESVLGYVEVHMEQGPQLEALGIPLGVVSAIAGQTRLRVNVLGTQGHAGTVPMNHRLDPLAAAAEAIHFVETRCIPGGGGAGSGAGSAAAGPAAGPEGYGREWTAEHDARVHRDFGPEDMLVCTVGEANIWPGASNVIAGSANFTVDIRSRLDKVRFSAVDDIVASVRKICDRRGVTCEILRTHDAEAIHCDDTLAGELLEAAREVTAGRIGEGGLPLPQAPMMVSGAGHDALAMADAFPVAMMFVRCRGGLSHTPLEFVSEEDVGDTAHALYRFLQKAAL